jgi:hypothetical protein
VGQAVPEPEPVEAEPEFMKLFPPKAPKVKPFKVKNVVKKKLKKK